MRHPMRMSLAKEKNSEDYIGKGPHGEYAITFRYDDACWLKVTVVNADGTTTEITPPAYSLTPTGGPEGTAKLTTSAAEKDTTRLIISRRTPAKQNLSLTSNAPLPAKDLEKALDHLAMAILDRDSSIPCAATSQALSFPIGEPKEHATRLPMPPLRKGMFISFSHATGEMELRPPSGVFHDGMMVALAAIESAKAATITVLGNALAAGTELLAKIPEFFKAEEGGGIKFGDVGGGSAGSHAINLQSRRNDEMRLASGPSSIVIGDSLASAEHSVSVGNQNQASGTYGTCVGFVNESPFQYGSAFGYNNHAMGEGAVAMGNANSTQQPCSVAIGAINQALEQNASAIGYLNTASATHATAVGSGNTASAHRSIAMGDHNTAGGINSVANGINNTASGYNTVAIGQGNTVSGGTSVAFGISNSVIGSEGTAAGFYNHLADDRSAAFGRYNHVQAADAGAIGLLCQAVTANSLAFGYGTVVGSGCVTEVANISYGSAARVRADAPSTTVSLSFGYGSPAPSPTLAEMGHEPSGTLANGMLSFRSDGAQLHIDVAVLGTIKTLSFSLP